jgi:hypothetical protein
VDIKSNQLLLPLTMKMEGVCSNETSVNFYQATWRHIPEDSTLHKFFFSGPQEGNLSRDSSVDVVSRLWVTNSWPTRYIDEALCLWVNVPLNISVYIVSKIRVISE